MIIVSSVILRLYDNREPKKFQVISKKKLNRWLSLAILRTAELLFYVKSF